MNNQKTSDHQFGPESLCLNSARNLPGRFPADTGFVGMFPPPRNCFLNFGQDARGGLETVLLAERFQLFDAGVLAFTHD